MVYRGDRLRLRPRSYPGDLWWGEEGFGRWTDKQRSCREVAGRQCSCRVAMLIEASKGGCAAVLMLIDVAQWWIVEWCYNDEEILIPCEKSSPGHSYVITDMHISTDQQSCTCGRVEYFTCVFVGSYDTCLTPLKEVDIFSVQVEIRGGCCFWRTHIEFLLRIPFSHPCHEQHRQHLEDLQIQWKRIQVGYEPPKHFSASHIVQILSPDQSLNH